MKNFKKVLACVLSVMALSSISLIPMQSSAIYISEDLTYYQEHPEIIEYYQENAITEAVLILEDAEEWSGTYYFCPVLENSSISLDSFTDEEIDSLKKACPVKIDDTVDTSAVEKVLTFKYGTDKIYIPIDNGYCYTNMSFIISRDATCRDENGNLYTCDTGHWVIDETAIPKTTTVDTSNTIKIYDLDNIPVVLIVAPNGDEYYIEEVIEEIGFAPTLTKIDENFDKSLVEQTIILTTTNRSFTIDFGHMSADFYYSEEIQGFYARGNVSIGDSDQTIGDSKVTALRGDVNLDGDVNGLDLLYLKKYLLGLIEW